MTRRTAILFSLVAVIGCQRAAPQSEVVYRASDDRHRALQLKDYGTVHFPRMELAGETREVCAEPNRRAPLSGDLASYDLVLPKGAIVELAFAVETPMPTLAPIEFIASLRSANGAHAETRMIVDGTEGHELRRWHAARVDAGEISGEARLVVSTASTEVGIDADSGLPVALLHSACPVVTAPADEEPMPDVLLISLDTLRADRLGIYGYDRPTSPNIDRIFGESGVTVERAYSQATNTIRGHAAMLTGLRPAVAVTAPEEMLYQRLRGFPSLADRLRPSGYLTAAFTENAFVSRNYGFAAGFELFHEDKSADPMAEKTHGARETFDRALAWIREHRDQRKFTFIHTYEVHDPYTPPTEHAAVFPATAGARQVDINSSLYDAEIHYLDAVLGNFIANLETLGLLDRTVVIVTADHGEEFGEHGATSHGGHLHDEVLRVPLLFRAPDLLPGGVRRPGIATLMDLTPTVLDLLELPIPNYLDGVSLRDHLRDDHPLATRTIPSEAFASLVFRLTGPATDWLPPSIALTRFPHRIIRIRTPTGARYEAYNLAIDPGEQSNLLASKASSPPEIAELIRDVDAYLDGASDRFRELSSIVGLDATDAAPKSVDPANLEKLRALGYVE